MSLKLRFLVLFLALTAVTACERTEVAVAPREVVAGTTCALDGMTLNDYPGPKAQIHYSDGTVEYYCDTVEMFNMVLKPETARRIRGVFTQDMGKADWKAPRGFWIDARQAFFVYGSKRRGSMGPTLAAFRSQESAAAFAAEFGGRVLRFDEVRSEMVDLHGGAHRDDRM